MMNSVKTTNTLLMILILGLFGFPIMVFFGIMLVAAIANGLTLAVLCTYLWPVLLGVGGILLVPALMNPGPAWAKRPWVSIVGQFLTMFGALAFITWIVTTRF